MKIQHPNFPELIPVELVYVGSSHNTLSLIPTESNGAMKNCYGPRLIIKGPGVTLSHTLLAANFCKIEIALYIPWGHCDD